MFEDMTFERIMARCLSRVSGAVDKREGSVIYDAIAPAAAELAQVYIDLGTLMDRAFPDTATDVDLTKKAEERSIFRRPASKAVRLGYFEDSNGAGYELTIGTRFSGGDTNYVTTERISAGRFKLEAEDPGAAGNVFFGTLFPIDFVDGLASAVLADVLIPGEDEEDDESLRERYFESLKSQAFGGNQTDYRIKVSQLPGVGSVKVVPVWNGGGTVKIIIVDSEWGVPSPELVAAVQIEIDPPGTQGDGVGIAPIGHVVTVVGVTGVTIDVRFVLTFEEGTTWDMVKADVEAAIAAYFQTQVKTWELSENIVVRVAQIETSVLNVAGIIDIRDTTINGGTANIPLEPSEIPTLGVVANGTS